MTTDKEFKARVDEAEAVITGEVIEEEVFFDPPIHSEHDPLWKTAYVRVLSVEKGDFEPEMEIEVAFASSTDVRWYQAPKLIVGITATLLLHRRDDVDKLAIVEPIDLVLLSVE